MKTWSNVYWANRGKYGISLAIWMADDWEKRQAKKAKPAPAANKEKNDE